MHKPSLGDVGPANVFGDAWAALFFETLYGRLHELQMSSAGLPRNPGREATQKPLLLRMLLKTVGKRVDLIFKNRGQPHPRRVRYTALHVAKDKVASPGRLQVGRTDFRADALKATGSIRQDMSAAAWKPNVAKNSARSMSKAKPLIAATAGFRSRRPG